MRLLPKSIHWCRRYPTKFNSGRDIPGNVHFSRRQLDDDQHIVGHEPANCGDHAEPIHRDPSMHEQLAEPLQYALGVQLPLHIDR